MLRNRFATLLRALARKSTVNYKTKSLAFEQLDERQLMAADLLSAAIKQTSGERLVASLAGQPAAEVLGAASAAAQGAAHTFAWAVPIVEGGWQLASDNPSPNAAAIQSAWQNYFAANALAAFSTTQSVDASVQLLALATSSDAAALVENASVINGGMTMAAVASVQLSNPVLDELSYGDTAGASVESSLTTTSYGGYGYGYGAYPPSISNFALTYLGNNLWSVTGTVTDDDSVAGRSVTLGGVLSGHSATIDEDGTFSTTISMPADTMGMATADYTDQDGLSAETAEYDLA